MGNPEFSIEKYIELGVDETKLLPTNMPAFMFDDRAFAVDSAKTLTPDIIAEMNIAWRVFVYNSDIPDYPNFCFRYKIVHKRFVGKRMVDFEKFYDNYE